MAQFDPHPDTAAAARSGFQVSLLCVEGVIVSEAEEHKQSARAGAGDASRFLQLADPSEVGRRAELELGKQAFALCCEACVP